MLLNTRNNNTNHNHNHNNNTYYMAESVFAMRLVNLLSVTCHTDQNFKEKAHFGALNLLRRKKG